MQRQTVVKLRVMCKRVFRDTVAAVAELPAAGIPAAATGGREMVCWARWSILACRGQHGVPESV